MPHRYLISCPPALGERPAVARRGDQQTGRPAHAPTHIHHRGAGCRGEECVICNRPSACPTSSSPATSAATRHWPRSWPSSTEDSRTPDPRGATARQRASPSRHVASVADPRSVAAQDCRLIGEAIRTARTIADHAAESVIWTRPSALLMTAGRAADPGRRTSVLPGGGRHPGRNRREDPPPLLADLDCAVPDLIRCSAWHREHHHRAGLLGTRPSPPAAGPTLSTPRRAILGRTNAHRRVAV
jgi:hypothetical protein